MTDALTKWATTEVSFGPVVEGPAVTYQSGTTFPKELPKEASSTLDAALLQKMKHFQRATDLPIHLRGGPLDYVLFGATVVLCAVGVAGCFSFVKDMSFPKKND